MDLQPYMDLFVHRPDVFASQQEGGAYLPVREPITTDHLAEHLAGFASYGVYTTRPEDHTVRYLMFDLDTHDEDAWTELCRLLVGAITPLRPFEYDCLMAESSGNKGKHIWLFFSEPVAARKARHWVNSTFMPEWVNWCGKTDQPRKVTDLEVFPKQDFVPDGGYGNLVKLPFGIHAVSGNPSEVIAKQGWANAVEDVRGLNPALLPEPPAQSTRPPGGGTGGPGKRVSPFPCITEILDNGVGKGNRDNAIFHIAVYLYGHGVDEDLALDQCKRAATNFKPPLSDREVEQRVRSAYRGRYSGAACGSGWLVDICPGPCKAGWKVGKTVEGGTLSSAGEGSTVEVTVRAVQREQGRTRVQVEHPDAQNTPTFVCQRSAR